MIIKALSCQNSPGTFVPVSHKYEGNYSTYIRDLAQERTTAVTGFGLP